MGVVVVEERKPWKCGNSGRGEGNNWTVDENGGLGLEGFYFYYFLFKTTTNAFLLSPLFCNNVFCFHSTTTFLFVLSLHRHLHRHHISIFSLRHHHFYRISIVSRHHIMTSHRQRRNVEKKFKIKKSSEDHTIRVI